MKDSLKNIKIENYTTFSGAFYKELNISYQLFGKELQSAPIVLPIHAFTANSNVTGDEKSWWKDMIGVNKRIDTNKYSILAFNIPGNEYDGEVIEEYKDFTAGDIARLFLLALEKLEINKIYASIGASLGGGIIWEMAAQNSDLFEYIIPIASDYQASDWIIGNCYVQEQIIKNSQYPLRDARIFSMLFYRSEASIMKKFARSRTDDDKLFNIESWLKHHGKKLEKRFSLNSYKLMNNLLASIDICRNGKDLPEVLGSIESKIVQIGIDSDILFTRQRILDIKEYLDVLGLKNEYYEIKSIHGHDAFLIEYDQLSEILKDIF